MLGSDALTSHTTQPPPCSFPPSFHIPKLSISRWDQNSIVSVSGRECDWGGAGLSIRARETTCTYALKADSEAHPGKSRLRDRVLVHYRAPWLGHTFLNITQVHALQFLDLPNL